jgi:hypothetical protein
MTRKENWSATVSGTRNLHMALLAYQTAMIFWLPNVKNKGTTQQRDSSSGDGSQATQMPTSPPETPLETSNKKQIRPNAAAKLSGKNTGKSRAATDDSISILAPNEMNVELVFESAGGQEQKIS